MSMGIVLLEIHVFTFMIEVTTKVGFNQIRNTKRHLEKSNSNLNTALMRKKVITKLSQTPLMKMKVMCAQFVNRSLKRQFRHPVVIYSARDVLSAYMLRIRTATNVGSRPMEHLKKRKYPHNQRKKRQIRMRTILKRNNRKLQSINTQISLAGIFLDLFDLNNN